MSLLHGLNIGQFWYIRQRRIGSTGTRYDINFVISVDIGDDISNMTGISDIVGDIDYTDTKNYWIADTWVVDQTFLLRVVTSCE